jgi:hypothetical protein
MKIKVRLARWLSLRIQEQTRKERRALRDYSRQELGRIRQAEIRSRGLRLRPKILWQARMDQRMEQVQQSATLISCKAIRLLRLTVGHLVTLLRSSARSANQC